MSVPELAYLPAHELAGLIARRAVSAGEAASAAIMQAEAARPAINCIAIPLYEEALAAAKAADASQRRGDPLGPLHGVPLTIKDGIATAGHPLTFGSASKVGEIAATDDLVWQRLKGAGAILLGKTTTPEFFHKVTTDSAVYGVTRNPWSTAHSPGGSSGGAAAALAAGIGALAVGSDGGGSLRCPASCTATFAIKPTMGRVPHGSFPDTFGNYSSLGPMARNARDLALMLGVLAGPAAADAASLARPTRTLHDAPMSARRIGVIEFAGTDPEVAALTGEALARLRASGASLVRLDAALLDGVFDIYRIISSVGHAGRARTTSPAAQQGWSDSFRALVDRGLGYSASDYEGALQARTRLFRAVQDALETVDMIATPVLTTLPFAVDAESSVDSAAYAAAAAPLFPFNLTGHPAISIPCGFSAGGLPVGLQLVGPWYGEAELLRLALLLDTPTLWNGRRPAL